MSRGPSGKHANHQTTKGGSMCKYADKKVGLVWQLFLPTAHTKILNIFHSNLQSVTAITLHKIPNTALKSARFKFKGMMLTNQNYISIEVTQIKFRECFLPHSRNFYLYLVLLIIKKIQTVISPAILCGCDNWSLI
jgi:hypothetical protein